MPEEKSRLHLANFGVKFLLIFNTFLWYFMVLRIRDNLLGMPKMSANVMITNTAFSSSIIISSLIGALLSSRVARRDLLVLWITIGVASSFLPAAVAYDQSAITVGVIFSILGVAFGLGIPSCLAYFADYTPIEKRGISAGVIILIIHLVLLPTISLLDMLGLFSNCIILAVWRMLGILFVLSKPKREPMPTREGRSTFGEILTAKPFLLYFLPWLSYCLLDSFENVILTNFLERNVALFNSIMTLEILLTPLSVFIGGLFADRIGRKRVVIYGFVALGFGYAAVGLLPNLDVSWYLYAVAYGVSAGFLMLMFVPLLWGDLSEFNSRERYYAIGIVPFFVSIIVQAFSTEYGGLVPVYASSSLASFFLFLAVLPLLYAPETLPEKEIELRRLRKYVEKARKVTEKHQSR